MMTEKRVCVVNDCEYCPYLEKVNISEKSKKYPSNPDYYKCNRTLLCVEGRKIYLKKPLQLLFQYCPLPAVVDDFKEEVRD